MQRTCSRFMPVRPLWCSGRASRSSRTRPTSGAAPSASAKRSRSTRRSSRIGAGCESTRAAAGAGRGRGAGAVGDQDRRAVRRRRRAGHRRTLVQRRARDAARTQRHRREPRRRGRHDRHRLCSEGAGRRAPVYVARPPPAGQTRPPGAGSHTIAGSLYAKLPYDPLKDFAPIAHIGNVDYVLLIAAAVPAKTVAEFIAYAKANPGKLNYASAGNGSATHLSMAYFCAMAGIEVVHVPFKATGEAVNEVLAGRAQAVISANIGAIPYAKDARVRMLGSTGKQRSKFLPELPSVDESGLPGYAFDSWIGLLGPAGTPRDAVRAINAAVAKLLQDPVILERLDKQGVVPQAMTPEAFGELLRADYAKMAKVVKISGARID